MQLIKILLSWGVWGVGVAILISACGDTTSTGKSPKGDADFGEYSDTIDSDDSEATITEREIETIDEDMNEVDETFVELEQDLDIEQVYEFEYEYFDNEVAEFEEQYEFENDTEEITQESINTDTFSAIGGYMCSETISVCVEHSMFWYGSVDYAENGMMLYSNIIW